MCFIRKQYVTIQRKYFRICLTGNQRQRDIRLSLGDIRPAEGVGAVQVELLVLLITLLVGRLNRNSRNSSKPPSSDPNRKRESKAKEERSGFVPGIKNAISRRIAGFCSLVAIVSENTLNSYNIC
jgi:hypothetical protein